MENFNHRFPIFGIKIFKNLDDQSLAQRKSINPKIAAFLENERSYWKRKIQKYISKFKRFEESWIGVIDKAPIDVLKKLFTAVQEYFEENSWRSKVAPLAVAVEKGNFQLCQFIIGKTNDKNPSDRFGNTPPHWAAENGNLDLCKLIIEKIEDKNPSCSYGITPLHKAVSEGHFEVSKLIIKNAENINPSDNLGSMPLHLGAKYGRLEVCKLIVEKIKEKNPRDNHWATPLHFAAINGDLDICKLIIEHLRKKIHLIAGEVL